MGDAGLMPARPNGGQRVGVASERHRLAHRILEALRLEEGDHGLGHGPLAGYIEAVCRSDVIQAGIQLIAKAIRDLPLDRGFGLARARQQNRQGRCLGALDALGMVMGDRGAATGFGEHLIRPIERPPNSADAHGRTVAVAAVRLGILCMHPFAEPPAVALARIRECIVPDTFEIAAARQDGVCDRQREHAVVGDAASPREQRKVVALLSGVLVDRSDHIA